MITKITKEMATPVMVQRKIILPSPGGGRARGPWGPKATQYAKIKAVLVGICSRAVHEESRCISSRKKAKSGIRAALQSGIHRFVNLPAFFS